MALTKEHIIRSIRNRCGLPERQSQQLIESLVETIKSTLQSGEDILISVFGKFCVKDKGEGFYNPHLLLLLPVFP